MKNKPKLPSILYALKLDSKCIRGTAKENDPQALPASKGDLALAAFVLTMVNMWSTEDGCK